jgi:glycerol-3-phosphate dehydrogenase (NAD(P)+)
MHSNSKAASIFKAFSTGYYRIFECIDASGVEICSTFKNIYSIAAGICDGIYKENFNGCYFNIIAFLFNQSLLEMLKIVDITGGQKDTAVSFAGTGDLHVTSSAGRNRRFGEMVGKGINPSEAFSKMLEEGEYGEGYIALKLSVPWLSNFGIDIKKELPLLSALYNIIYAEKNPEEIFKELISKLGT